MMQSVEAHASGAALEITVNAARLDAATAREFKKRYEEGWRPELNSVSVNLGQVNFLDSSGVGALLSLYRRLPPANPSVRLRQVQPPVRSVIELLRLHRIFEIEA